MSGLPKMKRLNHIVVRAALLDAIEWQRNFIESFAGSDPDVKVYKDRAREAIAQYQIQLGKLHK